jgi:hypothetical protein
MRRFVHGCLSAGAVLLALAAGPAAAEHCELPEWAAAALLPDERIVRCDICGDECLRVFVAAAGDSLAGRVVRVVRQGDDAARSVEAGWLRSDSAGTGGVLEFDPRLAADEAQAAVQAVRPHLKFGEQVLEIAPARTPATRPGREADDTEAHVVVVTLGRPGQLGRRELRVHVEPEGTFVETQGIRTH